MTAPVFSRRDAVTVPIGGRTYTVAPLTLRERVAFRADLTRASGLYPSKDQMSAALRAALDELSPGNTPELLAMLDAVEAGDASPAMLADVSALEATCSALPTYAALLAARQRYMGLLPYFAAKHALRGWDGPSLPPMARARGLVPDDLLDLLPPDELDVVGWAAYAAMTPDAVTEKNSEALSPSHESRADSSEG